MCFFNSLQSIHCLKYIKLSPKNMSHRALNCNEQQCFPSFFKGVLYWCYIFSLYSLLLIGWPAYGTLLGHIATMVKAAGQLTLWTIQIGVLKKSTLYVSIGPALLCLPLDMVILYPKTP